MSGVKSLNLIHGKKCKCPRGAKKNAVPNEIQQTPATQKRARKAINLGSVSDKSERLKKSRAGEERERASGKMRRENATTKHAPELLQFCGESKKEPRIFHSPQNLDPLVTRISVIFYPLQQCLY